MKCMLLFRIVFIKNFVFTDSVAKRFVENMGTELFDATRFQMEEFSVPNELVEESMNAQKEFTF